MMNIACILLPLTANFNWHLQQFDANNTFLHGELEKGIYVENFPKFVKGVRTNKIHQTKKSTF